MGVLSVVAQQILIIQQAKASKVKEFHFEGEYGGGGVAQWLALRLSPGSIPAPAGVILMRRTELYVCLGHNQYS